MEKVTMELAMRLLKKAIKNRSFYFLCKLYNESSD